MKKNITFRRSFLIIFFGLQIVGILAGKLTDAKFFCWAPYDQFSFYEAHVSIDGSELSEHEIVERYLMAKKGRSNRSIHNVISRFRQYEQTYSNEKNVVIELSYEINGYRNATWVWPQDSIISK